MILIADSGSTKTHWALVRQGRVGETVTSGLNPRLTDAGVIAAAIRQVRDTLLAPGETCQAVHFYGAGCGTEQMQQLMARQLADAFPQADIEVAGDLLGACRACCGSEAGLVGILGTGSNLCYYDGTIIARQRTSTGYVLGDEGSGNHIGRRLLKDYLEQRMPAQLAAMFHDSYPLTTDQFLDRLYRQPNANRFLASLAPFAARHQQESYIAAILNDCFTSFFRQCDDYGDLGHLPLHLVGGLVADFAPTLRAVAATCALSLATILQDPLPNLIRYHHEL